MVAESAARQRLIRSTELSQRLRKEFMAPFQFRNALSVIGSWLFGDQRDRSPANGKGLINNSTGWRDLFCDQTLQIRHLTPVRARRPCTAPCLQLGYTAWGPEPRAATFSRPDPE